MPGCVGRIPAVASLIGTPDECESKDLLWNLVDVSNVIMLLPWCRLATESQTLGLDLSSQQAPSVSDQLIKGLEQEGEKDWC